jgi:hypothetical protein
VRADQLALELGEAAQHGEHQAAVRRGAVGPGVTERPEAGLAVGHRGKGIKEIPRRSCQAVEPGHNQHVAGGELRSG